MDYLILAFATWRLASLFVGEEGPYRIFVRLRAWVGVRYNGETFQQYATNMISEGFTCIWCMSVWVGTILSIAYYLLPVVVVWLCLPLAISAGAICINKWVE